MTVPSHPAAVLPLKVWRPRWFDGVALAVGSTSPDVAYAFDGFGLTIRSHTWHGLFWWCLPVTLLGTWLIRRSAPVVAAHLPNFGPFALRDYGALSLVRHRLYVTISSALLGALSHNVWDTFTHRTMDSGVVFFPVLHNEPFGSIAWWQALQLLSDIVGPVSAIAVAIHIGRSHLLLQWHGRSPTTSRHPALFWSTTIGITAIGCTATPFLPGLPGLHVPGVRILCSLSVALLVAATVVHHRRSNTPREPTDSAV